MTPVKDTLGKARSGVATAVKAPARGASWASRRIRWRGSEAAGSVRRAFGATGQGIRWGFGGVRRGVGAGAGRVGSTFQGPRDRIAGTVESARQRPRYAVAVAAAILLGVAWIAWAIYVTVNTGATAGLGVLLTWPVLLGALALIAAPFVLTARLVQRHRGSTPAMAGGPAIAEPPAQSLEKQGKAKVAPQGKQGEPEAEEAEQQEDGAEPEQDPAAKSA